MRMISFKRLYKLHDFIFDNLLMMFAINVMDSSVNSEYLDSFLPFDPLLVSFMHSLYIFKTNIFFSLSISDSDSLETYFRWAF